MERRRKPRREAEDFLRVFDRITDQLIGGLANLTHDGAMFVSQQPIDISSVLNCRVQLPDEVLGRDQLIFDAECVWCKKDTGSGRYESGYRLTNVTAQDRDILTYVMVKLMSEQSSVTQP